MSRNVEAIAAILADLFAQTRRAFPAMQFTALDSEMLAEALAARGVLAVDSLTDEQADGMGRAIQQGTRGPFLDIERLRAALRRCATGEET